MDNTFMCLIFVTAMVIKFTTAVPPDYCLMPANLSDCGVPPTAIFSFYRPGSRCEIKTWRGCPTLNMFQDQYECHDHCIYQAYRFAIRNDELFHMKIDYGSNEVEKVPKLPTRTPHFGGPRRLTTAAPLPLMCREDLNTSFCSTEESGITVHTYDTVKGRCFETQWYHCLPDINMFDTSEECTDICVNRKNYWHDKLINMNEIDVEDLNDAIDNALEIIKALKDNNTDIEPDDNRHNDTNNNDPRGNTKNNTNNNVANNNSTNGNNIDGGDHPSNTIENSTDNGEHEGINSHESGNDVDSDSNHKEENSIHSGNKTDDNNNSGHIGDDSNNHSKEDDNGDSGNKKPDDNHSNEHDNNEDNRNSDNEKSSEEDDVPKDSGETNLTQVNFATTLAQNFKLNHKKYSLRSHSRRLIDFLNDNHYAY